MLQRSLYISKSFLLLDSNSSSLMSYCRLGKEFITLKNSRANNCINFFSFLVISFSHTLSWFLLTDQRKGDKTQNTAQPTKSNTLNKGKNLASGLHAVGDGDEDKQWCRRSRLWRTKTTSLSLEHFLLSAVFPSLSVWWEDKFFARRWMIWFCSNEMCGLYCFLFLFYMGETCDVWVCQRE